MGLLNWFKPNKQANNEQPDFNENDEFDLDALLDSEGPERPQLYVFQQEALPEALYLNHPELIAELNNDEPALMPLLHFWSRAEVLCENYSYIEEDSIDYDDENCFSPFDDIKRHNFKEQGYTLTIFSMPEPEYVTECYYVGMLYRDDEVKEFMQVASSSQYFTLEKMQKNGDACFCGISPEATHLNYGELNEPTLENFKKAIFNRLET